MPLGRTVSKNLDVLIDGFDFSAYFAMSDGLKWAFDAPELHGAGDPAKGYLPNNANISPGNLSGVYDTTASTGPHVNLNGAGVKRTVAVIVGSASPSVLGDPVFGGSFYQSQYGLPLKAGMVPMTVPFPMWAADAATLVFANPWGQLLNNVNRTTTNSSAGTDNLTGLTSTLFGGYMVYHVIAGDTAGIAIKVQDSADNAAFADLAGATTGAITATAGLAGVIAIGRTATVRRYLRWQTPARQPTARSFCRFTGPTGRSQRR